MNEVVISERGFHRGDWIVGDFVDGAGCLIEVYSHDSVERIKMQNDDNKLLLSFITDELQLRQVVQVIAVLYGMEYSGPVEGPTKHMVKYQLR